MQIEKVPVGSSPGSSGFASGGVCVDGNSPFNAPEQSPNSKEKAQDASINVINVKHVINNNLKNLFFFIVNLIIYF